MKIFNVIYMEIERQKLNKTTYSDILSHALVQFYLPNIDKKGSFLEQKMIIFSVHRLPCSHVNDPQADFHICCVALSPLRNGKRIPEKKVIAWGEKWLTLSVSGVIREGRRVWPFFNTFF